MDALTIINELGGAAALARALGMPGNDVGAKAVRAWGMRDSIPADWFAAVERVAKRHGQDQITVAALAAHAERRRLTKLRRGD